MIYTMEREFFPRYKLRWKSHDRVGFCEGIDLGKWRWDSSAHAVDDERRTDPEGNGFLPFHDVQMAVDREAGAALADQRL